MEGLLRRALGEEIENRDEARKRPVDGFWSTLAGRERAAQPGDQCARCECRTSHVADEPRNAPFNAEAMAAYRFRRRPEDYVMMW